MKRTYKLTPVSEYDIAGLESWLENMARRGLYLKKFRPLFCTFTRGEPQQTRYRIEPHKRPMDSDLPQSMLELYQDFGWEYVDEIGRSMLIFSTQDLQAPELHTDPETQWKQWNKLRRSVTVSFWVNLIIFLLVLGLLVWTLWDQPISALITTNEPILILFLLYSLTGLPTSFADVQKLSLIARQLKEGIPLNHQALYPRRRPAAALSFIAAVTLFAILIACQYILPFTGGGAQNLDHLMDFPLLSLNQVEGTGLESDHFVVSGVDYANFCRRTRYLLCWNQWQVVQSGSCGADDLWVRMEIHWYDLPGSLLAIPLAQEQLDQAMALDDDIWWTSDASVHWTVDYYQRDDTDFMAVGRSDSVSFQVAVAAAGDKVAVVHYTGHGDLSGHLAEIAAMVCI